MVRGPLAIRKGMSAEYLAKAHFSKQGHLIFSPDCHESHFDFIAGDKRVQVKSIIEYPAFNIARIRNKHGSTNRLYSVEDYDILAGVWVNRNKIYLFNSKDVNGICKETITIARLDGTELRDFNRPVPFYAGDI